MAPALTEDGAVVVEWFRIDRWASLRRTIAISLGTGTLGCLLVGAALGRLASRLTDGMAVAEAMSRVGDTPLVSGGPVAGPDAVLLAFGLLFSAASPVALGFGFGRHLLTEDFLLVRSDGLLQQVGACRDLLPWDEIRDIGYDTARDAVVLERASGELFVLAGPYAGQPARALAERLAQHRRRALFGLLGRSA